MPASPYAYPVHQMLPADVPLPQPVGEAGLAGAAVMMQPSCIEVISCWSLWAVLVPRLFNKQAVFKDTLRVFLYTSYYYLNVAIVYGNTMPRFKKSDYTLIFINSFVKNEWILV